jgi:phage recombination protein Bet
MNELVKVDEKTIMDYLVGSETKLTESQKKLFISLAIKNNLDPFKREIYAIPYGNKMSVVTGYEVYLKRAEASKMLDGWKCWIEGEKDLLKAVVEITRKDWSKPFVHEVFMSEYNTKQGLWNTKPMTMLKKVAIAQAFRLAFPNELGGMIYTADEMQDAQPIEKESQVKELPEEVQKEEPTISQGQSKYVHIFFKKAGFDEQDKSILLQHYFNAQDTLQIARKDWTAFNHEMEKLLNRKLTKDDSPISEEEFGLIGDYLTQVLATLNTENLAEEVINE